MNHRTTEPVEDALVVDRWKFAIVRLAVLGDLSFANGLDAPSDEMLSITVDCFEKLRRLRL
jgi:hypothetical protein